MPTKKSRDLIVRFDGNPLIEVEDLPFNANSVLNAGATRFDNKILLLIRYENLAGYSKFVIAKSLDGFRFEIEDKPFMEPEKEGPYKEYEELGIEDPRITLLEDTYYITYTAHSNNGHRVGLAKTKDFKSVERIALVTEPDNKNGVLFPKKIDGRYAMLNRPSEGGNIWLSYSDDLVYWGDSRVALTCRGGGFWDGERVGTSIPPIEIKEGWLLLYYGVKNIMGNNIFSVGACVLDKKEPYKVIGRSTIPILSPREIYERSGNVPNMVFPCGAVVDQKMNELKVYYGSSLTCIALGTVPLDNLINCCLKED